MLDLQVEFKTFKEQEHETTYKLTYKEEVYLIIVPHNEKFHNKLWECEKEIPEELIWFVDTIIRRSLENRRKDCRKLY